VKRDTVPNNRNTSPEILRAREAFANARTYSGVITLVAKKTRLSKTQVTRVLSGERTSPRVERFLAKEIRQIERKAERRAA